MKTKLNFNSTFLFKIFTLIVSLAGLLSLALCQNYILAIYQLNLISIGDTKIAASLIMFIYVLLGLVCVFQAIRTKEGHCKSFYVTLVVLIVELLLGAYLLLLYINGYGEVTSSKKAKITPGIILTGTTLVLYVCGIVSMFIASHKETKEIKALDN